MVKRKCEFGEQTNWKGVESERERERERKRGGGGRETGRRRCMSQLRLSTKRNGEFLLCSCSPMCDMYSGDKYGMLLATMTVLHE